VHDTTKRDSSPALSNASPAALVETLSHPNGWWRDTAQRLLVERNDKSVAGALQKLALGAKDPRTRLHALWTLDGMDSVDPATVVRALADPSRDVRASAVRVSERWLREPNHPIHAAVLKLASDTDWAVRTQLGASIGELAAGPRETALASFLTQHATDPIAADAAMSGITGSEAAVLDILLQGETDTPQRSAAVTLVAGAVVAAAQDAPIQALFDRIADARRPAWQRSALLRGAEVALLGVPPPGTPAGGRGRGGAAAAADAPCFNCPGGRAGPGGAAAFPAGRSAAPAAEGVATAAGAGRGGRGRGGAGGPALKLTREPALGTIASRDDDLGKRAAAVLARVEWPGKPGIAPPVTPLTPAELVRFNAGREVYQNLCMACHQEDGRGREKMATSLVGSAFVLGAPDIPVRVLINGKEGAVGLMPPLGAALSDEQVAAVLTHVRRAWDNAGSPLTAADVAPIRALTAGRTRPWTDAELAALRGGR